MSEPKIVFLLIATLSIMPLFAENEAVISPVALQGEEIKEIASPEETVFRPFTGKVKGNRVRLRSLPTLDSYVLRETHPGEMFAITGIEKDFYIIRPSKEFKGYVFRTFVLDNVVEGDRVNVRVAPDTDAPIIGQLHSGEQIQGQVCAKNNKWLEVPIPSQTRFFIAKEYVENVGPLEMFKDVEARREQALHVFGAAFHFAQAELQKPFDEISFDAVHQKLAAVQEDFAEFTDIVEKAKEMDVTVQEAYIQKKIAFLESKTDQQMADRGMDALSVQKMHEIGRYFPMAADNMADVGKATSTVFGHSALKNAGVVTDKMLVWQSLEESLYHLWAVNHEGKSMEDFYAEEWQNANTLTGIVEPYSRSVKNTPGDYLLRGNHLPLAFLYSTKVNLQDFVGKKVKVVSAPRPNNNFAFPAYFVLSVE